MMLIDYSHKKTQILKIKNLLNILLRVQESFNTCKWGVMYMTFKTKL